MVVLKGGLFERKNKMNIKKSWIYDVSINDKIQPEDIMYVKECIHDSKLSYHALKTSEKILLETLTNDDKFKECKVLYYSYVDVLTIVGKITDDSFSIEKIKYILDIYRIQLFKKFNLNEEEKLYLFNKLCCHIIYLYKNKYEKNKQDILLLINEDINKFFMDITSDKLIEKNKKLVLNKKNKLFA